MEQTLRIVLDWKKPVGDFIQQVDDAIAAAKKLDKVVPLPIEAIPGVNGIEMMSLIISTINCEGCRARCCRDKINDKPIAILPNEYEMLKKLLGEKALAGLVPGENVDLPNGVSGRSWNLPVPCPFLKNSRCGIYEIRPSVCVLYPVQLGAVFDGKSAFAISPACPEACRIARHIYLTAYRFRQNPVFKDTIYRGIIPTQNQVTVLVSE